MKNKKWTPTELDSLLYQFKDMVKTTSGRLQLVRMYILNMSYKQVSEGLSPVLRGYTLSPDYIARAERDALTPHEIYLKALAEMAGINFDWLVTGKGFPVTPSEVEEAEAFFDALDQPAAETSDGVNHPAHYGGDTPYEAIKVIRAWALGFNLGNAVKYIARAGKKDDMVKDLEKAVWYLQDEIAFLKAEANDCQMIGDSIHHRSNDETK